MEENLQETCSTNSKKCCTKGIIIIIVCSLLCFFIGYYVGNKSTNKHFRPNINRPFSSTRVPRVPKIPKPIPQKSMPRIQNQNIPKMPPRVNTPNTSQIKPQNIQSNKKTVAKTK